MKTLQQRLDEITLPDIKRNNARGFPDTEKREHIFKLKQVRNLRYIPYVPNGVLQVEAKVRGTAVVHNTQIELLEVDYQEERGNGAASFFGVDGQRYEMLPHNTTTKNIKIDCNCADFRFRFAQLHANNKSLVGTPPAPYIAHTNRPPVNPFNALGACAHILALADRLRTGGLLK